MNYQHQFRVQAPVADVAAFHTNPDSMRAITPPPIIVQNHALPPRLYSGAEIDFTLWLGPLPIRWVSAIDTVLPTGFIDRQRHGPFATWEHRHIFIPESETTTLVFDTIEADLKTEFPWRLLGWMMWLNMPILFAYRAWRTRQLLNRG